MKDMENRATIEWHARQLLTLTSEPVAGYGFVKKESIVTRIRRMLEIAEELQ
jgi:hypothetical protein